MSGHNKWSTIKRKKEKTDAARGKLFTKWIREIIVAVREGGGDPNNNNRLKSAISGAKSVNMPNDNIKRAIQKGLGGGDGTNFEEVIYEGYGHGGAAIFVTGTTDNKNRTAAEIRHIFSKYGGSLGETGCVSWMFEKKGYITVDATQYDEETLMDAALDAGAEDVLTNEDIYEVLCSSSNLENIKGAFDNLKIHYKTAGITYIPQSTIKLNDKDKERVIKLLEKLDENDDVSEVYNNVNWT